MTHSIKSNSSDVLYCEYCGIRDFTEECKFKLNAEERELKFKLNAEERELKFKEKELAFKEKEFTEQSTLKVLEIKASKDSSYALLALSLLLFLLLIFLICVMYYGMDNIGKKFSEMIAQCNLLKAVGWKHCNF